MKPTGQELPIACTLGAADMPQRRRRWEAIANSAMLASEHTTGGARQTYRPGEEVECELAELIRLEAECCAFLDFDLRREGDRLVLDISGPPEAASIIELFAARPA